MPKIAAVSEAEEQYNKDYFVLVIQSIQKQHALNATARIELDFPVTLVFDINKWQLVGEQKGVRLSFPDFKALKLAPTRAKSRLSKLQKPTLAVVANECSGWCLVV